MDKEQVITLVNQYLKLLTRTLKIKKVVLFGSYSRGDQNEWSDIDVAVFLNEKPDDLLIAESRLYKLRREIDSRIEPIILDEEKDQSGFANEILKTGIVIYQSN